ncbi:alpha/beta fold hydrolase [Rosenbergiella sp. S61]|uniref:Alpha/beta fold hydrolase n=1 Tax=Rosenbergiella gaditana TaxID=2726987 RepID=A0ABS5SYS3_9GAMM|nr:alpha/beta fold hydrolase [Rosenbergiella gaditana]MBT0725255.1 alpha/beta fold hydrolase [Rosenbergiella gaditana]
MILNNRLHSAQFASNQPAILLIHGLFGSLDNLGILARDLRQTHTVLQVDVRNHGLSPRSEQMDYAAMAQDMFDTLDSHHLSDVIVIGHSMGGKIAMAMTALFPSRIKQLVIIDIAPVHYTTRRHDSMFAAMEAVTQAGVSDRREAKSIMERTLDEADVIQFLLKSFHHGEWRFAISALWNNYTTISDWETLPEWHGPVLFIRGKNSTYLDACYQALLLAQFPQAKAYVIAGAGHWVHAEKPQAVQRAVNRFLSITG